MKTQAIGLWLLHSQIKRNVDDQLLDFKVSFNKYFSIELFSLWRKILIFLETVFVDEREPNRSSILCRISLLIKYVWKTFSVFFFYVATSMLLAFLATDISRVKLRTLYYEFRSGVTRYIAEWNLKAFRIDVPIIRFLSPCTAYFGGFRRPDWTLLFHDRITNSTAPQGWTVTAPGAPAR